MLMTDYRTRLRNVREDRDLTQAEVGKILNKSVGAKSKQQILEMIEKK